MVEGLDLVAVVKRKANFTMQEVGGRYILVPLGAQVMQSNGIITLNETAAYVWKMLAVECNLNELAIAVSKRFDVDAKIARDDVENFVDEIIELGLLEP